VISALEFFYGRECRNIAAFRGWEGVDLMLKHHRNIMKKRVEEDTRLPPRMA
jgi:hypothetical protein